MQLFGAYDKKQSEKILINNKRLNDAFDGIREFSSDLSTEITSKGRSRKLQNLIEFAIAIEAARNIVAKNLLPLALSRQREGIHFSAGALLNCNACTTESLLTFLATNVLIPRDVDIAQQL